MSESELVTKLKALPIRERQLWYDMTISNEPIGEVVARHGITVGRALEILAEINVRLGIAEKSAKHSLAETADLLDAKRND